jgi:putative phage-type endonuclease
MADDTRTKWLNWRSKGIGSSDAPVIMGVSPYMTRLELWKEKLGLERKDRSSFATELGNKFEIRARSWFCLDTGIEIDPENCQHKDFVWLRASLDGFNEQEKIFVEIKYMGQKNYDLVKSSGLPLDHHHPQLQHQFLVTGYSKAFYIPYTLDSDKKEMQDIFALPIFPDHAYIEKLFAEERDFWQLIQDKKPPLDEGKQNGKTKRTKKQRESTETSGANN